MRHVNTELIIDYWRALRAEGPAPARADVDPAGFAGLAPQVFIAARDGAGDVRFRLAGERVIDLHGAPLAGLSLAELWTAPHRGPLATALAASLARAEPLLITAEAAMSQGPPLAIEILFAPLVGAAGRADRFLGCYQPLAPAGGAPIRSLRILAINGAGAESAEPRLRLAVLNGQRLA